MQIIIIIKRLELCTNSCISQEQQAICMVFCLTLEKLYLLHKNCFFTGVVYNQHDMWRAFLTDRGQTYRLKITSPSRCNHTALFTLFVFNGLLQAQNTNGTNYSNHILFCLQRHKRAKILDHLLGCGRQVRNKTKQLCICKDSALLFCDCAENILINQGGA